MSLKARIEGDLRQAMKQRDAAKVGALRMIVAAVKNREIEERKPLADDAVNRVLTGLIKQRQEAAKLFRDGGREELATKEEGEAALLASYLPEQMGEADLQKIVEAVVAEVGAQGPSDVGKVMKILMPKIAGRADGALASTLVRKKLAS